MVVASLPMYDLPELRRATDAWWSGLARAFRRAGIEDVPDRLERDASMWDQWRDPALLFSQTCGYPLTFDFKDVVQTVATPAYAAAGCSGARYCSLVVVRADDPAARVDDLRGRTCAFNAVDSQSGYNALRRFLAPAAGGQRFFGAVVRSGGHAASLDAVAAGRADVAAVDCVTFALFSRWRPEAVAGLRVLARTEPVPGLPYVTSAATDRDTRARLREGLERAVADPALEAVRSDLLLVGVDSLPLEAYGRIPEMAAEADDLGYPKLA